MTTSSQTIQFGAATVTIPVDCPRPDLFRDVFFRTLKHYFASFDQAGEALAAWQRLRVVPQPFNKNPTAAQLYREACLALDPLAEAWVNFEDSLFQACLPYADDGDAQEPAVPGWHPDAFDLAA